MNDKFNRWQRAHRAKKSPPKPLKTERKDFASKTRWNHENREYRAEHYLRTKYGISSADFQAMLEAQGNRCALNPAHAEPEEYKAKVGRRGGFWHVDHDHVTGKVRGILCRTCNTALGALGDNIAGVTLALNYLLKHENQDQGS